ncbi:type IV secretion protein Rhs [Pseudomonas sp. Bc-h]|uniref:RHS repeat-associated core domain-containing protein n=1 Tax=Pseudomonas sp. Bc-h TaxID=1943632 RepID=UPI0009DAF216|nr:RHS repeat-associated core domain-containing protein [Pseudomonas sp. Bc-h]OQR34104.1 type IV secretion protein Rhs [Pseudomonas sp. Bc-h]
MSDALWAARVGDALSHTSMMADILGGVLEVAANVAIGALATAAVVAAAGFTIATAGVGGCILGAVIGVVVSVTMSKTGADKGLSALCENFANSLFPPMPQATISTGSADTFINGIPAARAAGYVPSMLFQAGSAETEQTEESNTGEEAHFLDMAKGFFSQMWRPTVATPAPGAVPKPLDMVSCTRHPPMPPQFLAEGSDKVTINGQPAIRSGDRSTCDATVVSSGLISPNVRIGGSKVVVREIRSGKTPGVGLAITALMMLRGSKGKFLSNLPCMLLSGVNSFVVSQAMGALTNAIAGSPNPVHAATGAKVLGGSEELDFVLSGVLPITWQRFYNSRDERRDGLFGAGWSVGFEVSVRIEAHPDGGERLIYIDEQARSIDMGSIALGSAVFSAGEGLAVRRHGNGQLLIESEDGIYRLFEPTPGESTQLRLTQLGDRNDNRIYLDYDQQGRLIQLRDTFDVLRVTLVYSVRWPQRVETIERVLNDETREALASYDYDDSGDLVEVRDALRQIQRNFSYQNRRMVEHRLPTGLRCFYEWGLVDDSEWRVVHHWTDDGAQYRFEYDLSTGSTAITDGLNRTSTRRWNSQHQITEYTDTLGQTWRFSWNDERQLLSATDPQGGEWHYSYDDAGNIGSTQDPLGRVESTSWLEHWSLPMVETDAAGSSWQYRYDERGNCTREVDPMGQVTQYRYDERGQIIEVIDATEKSKKLRWNERGQVEAHTDCSGYRTWFEYDARGHLSCITDPSGERTIYQHDARGRLLRRELPDGRIERYQRDAIGLLTAYVDPAGDATSYHYDLRGQVRHRLDPHRRQVQFSYDAYGRLQSLTNENRESYRFAWDAGDRLLAQQDLDGSQRRYRYDTLGNPVRVEQIAAAQDGEPGAGAIIQCLERDAAGRLKTKVTVDGRTEYVLDALDHLAEVTFTDTAGAKQTIGFAYDTLGQLVAEKTASGTLQHCYDELGNLTQSLLPDGRWLNRLYYGSGHLHQINLDGQVISDFERDRLHREVLRSQGQLTTRSQYDRSGRLRTRQRRATNLPRQLPAQLTHEYEYDPSDNLIGRTRLDRQRSENRRESLHYDSSSRLCASQNSLGQQETFAYDAAANLLDGPQSGAGLVRHNRLLTYQDKRYRYDGFGRLVEKRSTRHGIQRFIYDAESRLIEVHNQNGNVVRMAYDPLGRRIAKSEHRADDSLIGETRFTWDGLRLLQEQRINLASLYIYSGAGYEPLARVDGIGEHQQVRYYHNDLNGLPEQLTEADGHLVWQARYQVWGNTIEEQRERYFVEEQNLRFQGQYLDRETGLHYNTFRFYDPDVGRFTTPDPIGLLGGLNLYQYAPNPIGWVDPWGWACTKAFSKRSNIAKRWVNSLSGKTPHQVENMLLSKGYIKRITNLNTHKTQHIQFFRTTKRGMNDVLDYHPGGGVHGTSYWKIYRNGDVQGRIAPSGFSRYERVVDSPVFVDGTLMNGPS